MSDTAPPVSAAPAAPRVTVIRRRHLSPAAEHHYREVVAEIERLGWRWQVRYARALPKGRQGRPAGVALDPKDAGNLYRAAHRVSLLLVALESTVVRLDPSADRPVRATSDFFDHKACVLLIGDRPAVAAMATDFAAWQASRQCVDFRDPRALPLHVFAAGRPWPELVDAPGRQAFRRTFGSPTARSDANSRRWEKANHAHGGQSSVVAGTDLGTGVHWDVQFDRAGRLFAADEVWHVPRRSYVNVYPDGGVREGSRNAPSAKRVWS